MPKYIDITELSKQIADFKKAINSPNSDYMTGYVCALSVTGGIIADTLTADVVEVVRCKDCKYCCISTDPKTNISIQVCGYVGFNPVQSSQVPDDFYCGYGELKERDQNAR